MSTRPISFAGLLFSLFAGAAACGGGGGDGSGSDGGDGTGDGGDDGGSGTGSGAGDDGTGGDTDDGGSGDSGDGGTGGSDDTGGDLGEPMLIGEPVPIGEIQGIWGSAPDDVYAVASSASGNDNVYLAIVAHYDGSTWTGIDTEPIGGPAFGSVWVSDTGVMYGAGNSSWHGVYIWDGSMWATETGFETAGIFGFSDSDIWTVGAAEVTHFDGSSWTTEQVTGNFVSIWGSGPSDVWAAGYSAAVLHYDGSTWTDRSAEVADSGPLQNVQFNAIHGSSADDVWFVGNGAAVHWDGSEFTQPLPDSELIDVVWSFGPTDVWFAGMDGRFVWSWDGTTKTEHQFSEDQFLELDNKFAMWASGPKDLLVGGKVFGMNEPERPNLIRVVR